MLTVVKTVINPVDSPHRPMKGLGSVGALPQLNGDTLTVAEGPMYVGHSHPRVDTEVKQMPSVEHSGKCWDVFSVRVTETADHWNRKLDIQEDWFVYRSNHGAWAMTRPAGIPQGAWAAVLAGAKQEAVVNTLVLV